MPSAGGVFLGTLPTLFSSLPSKVGSFTNFNGFSFVLLLTGTLALDFMPVFLRENGSRTNLSGQRRRRLYKNARYETDAQGSITPPLHEIRDLITFLKTLKGNR